LLLDGSAKVKVVQIHVEEMHQTLRKNNKKVGLEKAKNKTNLS